MSNTLDVPASSPPSIIFIVPYRNRSQHKVFFCKYMKFILEDFKEGDYEIYFSHQCDARSFNRGAMKNIGFLAMKQKYPNHYKNITFVFNDVDTVPYNKLFDYSTIGGTVKHFYGFKYTLGGIVSIKGADFERINGFPNFWGWGMEDNVLQTRCEKNGLIIDRSHFYPIGAREVLQIFDGVSRIISKKDPWRAAHDTGVDGLITIHQLKYSIDLDSLNSEDNAFEEETLVYYFINATSFLTGVRHEEDIYTNYDLREPPRRIVHPSKIDAARAKTLTHNKPVPATTAVAINNKPPAYKPTRISKHGNIGIKTHASRAAVFSFVKR
jgi:hypothetical protein